MGFTHVYESETHEKIEMVIRKTTDLQMERCKIISSIYKSAPSFVFLQPFPLTKFTIIKSHVHKLMEKSIA
jgi:hypothetical protein